MVLDGKFRDICMFFVILVSSAFITAHTLFITTACKCNLISPAGEEQVRWREEYESNISKMMTSVQQTKPDQFVTCVQRVQLHYAPIVDKYVESATLPTGVLVLII